MSRPVDEERMAASVAMRKQGMRNAEIAKILGVEAHTVSHDVQRYNKRLLDAMK